MLLRSEAPGAGRATVWSRQPGALRGAASWAPSLQVAITTTAPNRTAQHDCQ